MPEFTQSWAFWFLVVIISFAAGFLLAAILAGSGKASRMEEKIEGELASRPLKISIKNHFSKSETEIATQGKPEDA